MSKENNILNIQRLIKENKYEEALQLADKLIEDDEQNHEAYIFKAGILQLMHRQEEGIKEYENITELFPNNTKAYLELITIYDVYFSKDKKALKKIIDLCNKVETIDEVKTPYYILAHTFKELEEYDVASEIYDKAIKQEAIHIRACAIIMKKKKHNKQILELASNNIKEGKFKLYNSLTEKAECLLEMAQYLNSLKEEVKWKEAIDLYKTAIELNKSINQEHASYFEYEEIANIYEHCLKNPEKAKLFKGKAEKLEKIHTDVYDIEQGRMTEDEFDKWYDDYFDVDKEGKIIGIKKKREDIE